MTTKVQLASSYQKITQTMLGSVLDG